MPYTEAQKKATIKYLNEKTDDIRLRVPKGTKEKWKGYAEKANKSMTVYVCDAVDNQIKYDETGQHEIDNDLILNLINWLKVHGHDENEIIDCFESLSVDASII